MTKPDDLVSADRMALLKLLDSTLPKVPCDCKEDSRWTHEPYCFKGYLVAGLDLLKDKMGVKKEDE